MANNYYNFPIPFVAGTKVRSDQMNTQLGGVESGFDLLPTNAAATIIGTAALGIEAQGATVNEYEVTSPDPQSAYADGQQTVFQATHTNDNVSTLNVDGLGAVNIVRSDGSSVVANDLVSGLFYECRYDNANTRFQMMTVATSFVSSAVAAAVAAAASAAAALASENAAAVSAAAALVSQDAAESWAIEPEDVPVPIIYGGDGVTTFSSLHWAAKSAAGAGAPVGVIGDIQYISAGTNVYSATSALQIEPGVRVEITDDFIIDKIDPRITFSANGADGYLIYDDQFVGGPTLDMFINGAEQVFRAADSTVTPRTQLYLAGNVNPWVDLQGSGVSLRLGAQGGVGDVGLYDDTDLVGQTLQPGAGGFQVNNALTGGGLERVLTVSDLFAGATAQLTATSANPIDLVDTDVALRVGAADPDTAVHLELGVGVFGAAIQAKATDTTVADLELNRLGGDVEIGSRSATVAGGVNLNFANGAGAVGIVIQLTQSGIILEGITGSNTILDFHTPGGNLVVREVFNGANMLWTGFLNSLEYQFASRDSGGTTRQLLHMDPDNGLELYWGATGTIVAQTLAAGFGVIGTLLDLDNAANTLTQVRAVNTSGGIDMRVEAGGLGRISQLSAAAAFEDTWMAFTRNGQVEGFNNNVGVFRSVTAANGGLEANNTSTGAGYERVLTTSDLGGGGAIGETVAGYQGPVGQNIATATLTNVTNMVFTLPDNASNWEFSGAVEIARTAAGAGNINLGFSITGSSPQVNGIFELYDTAGVLQDILLDQTSLNGGTLVLANQNAHILKWRFAMDADAGTAPTIQMQIARTGGSDTINVGGFGYMKAVRLD